MLPSALAIAITLDAIKLCSTLAVQVVGLEHLAERDPSSHVTTSEPRYSAPHSAVLRFSITSLHFVIIAVVMVSCLLQMGLNCLRMPLHFCVIKVYKNTYMYYDST